MPEDDRIVITNRDVYDLLKNHIETNTAWQVAHAAADAKSFGALNIKFYGILTGMLAILVALGAALRV